MWKWAPRRRRTHGEVWSKTLFKSRMKDKDILSTATMHSVTKYSRRKEDFEMKLQPLHFAAKGLRLERAIRMTRLVRNQRVPATRDS